MKHLDLLHRVFLAASSCMLASCAGSVAPVSDNSGAKATEPIWGWYCNAGIKLFPNIRMGLKLGVTVDGPEDNIARPWRPARFVAYYDDENGGIITGSVWGINPATQQLNPQPHFVHFSLIGPPALDGQLIFEAEEAPEIVIGLPSHTVRPSPDVSGVRIEDSEIIKKLTNAQSWNVKNVAADGRVITYDMIHFPNWGNTRNFYNAMNIEIRNKMSDFENRCDPVYYPELDDEAITDY